MASEWMMRTMNCCGKFYVLKPVSWLIVDVGSAISLLRSTSENYQDYIPVLFIRSVSNILDYAILPG